MQDLWKETVERPDVTDVLGTSESQHSANTEMTIKKREKRVTVTKKSKNNEQVILKKKNNKTKKHL